MHQRGCQKMPQVPTITTLDLRKAFNSANWTIKLLLLVFVFDENTRPDLF